MKKFLVCLLIVLFCVSLAACSDEADKKDAYTAQCDALIQEYIGTQKDSYTYDNISYELKSFTLDQQGFPHAEIWWYLEVSGEYDIQKVITRWLGIALDATEYIECNGYKYQVYYFNEDLDDNCTVILNGEHAMNGASKYVGYPPFVPNSSIGTGITMMVLEIIMGLMFLVYGWMQTPKNGAESCWVL